MNNFYQNTGTYCVKLVFISEEKNLDFLKKDDFNIDKDKKKKKNNTTTKAKAQNHIPSKTKKNKPTTKPNTKKPLSEKRKKNP